MNHNSQPSTGSAIDLVQSPRPEEIDASQHFWDSFGNAETEISARDIVAFCQDRDQGWQPFTYEAINTFYQQRCKAKSPGNFTFNRLVEGTHSHMTAQSFPQGEQRSNNAVIAENDGRYYITQKFVDRCYKSSPQKLSGSLNP